MSTAVDTLADLHAALAALPPATTTGRIGLDGPHPNKAHDQLVGEHLAAVAQAVGFKHSKYTAWGARGYAPGRSAKWDAYSHGLVDVYWRDGSDLMTDYHEDPDFIVTCRLDLKALLRPCPLSRTPGSTRHHDRHPPDGTTRFRGSRCRRMSGRSVPCSPLRRRGAG